jgi:hypothetical protein
MVTALTSIPLFLADASPHGVAGPAGGPDHQAHPGTDPASVALDRAERRAVSALLAAGLVTTSTANAARATIDAAAPVAAPAAAPVAAPRGRRHAV